MINVLRTSFRIFFKISGALVIFLMGVFWGAGELGRYDLQFHFNVVPDGLSLNTKQIKLIGENKQIEYRERLNYLARVSDPDSNTSEESQNETVEEFISAEKTLQNHIALILNEQHGIAYSDQKSQQLYNKICRGYKSLCNTIVFNGDFTVQEKFVFTTVTIYLITEIDKRLLTKNKLYSTIYRLTINKTGQGRRGYAGHHTITINLKSIGSYREYREILTHEFGHVIDLGILEGSSNTKSHVFTEYNKQVFSIDDLSLDYYKYSWINENTRKAGTKSLDFASGYGHSDPFEDFAESVNLYLNHYNIFKHMSNSSYIIGQKFEFLESIFGGRFLLSDKNKLWLFDSDPGRRPWDTTKINEM